MRNKEGASAPAVVLLVLDASPEVGVGHALRCQALAEELIARGFEIQHVGQLTVPWVISAYRGLGIDLLGDAPLLAAAGRPEIVAVVVDSYTLPVRTSGALAEVGKPVLAIIDDSTRGLRADLFLEQNLGSSPQNLRIKPPAQLLCGPQFALLRDTVLRRRDRPWQPKETGPPPHVTVLFGGTDPAHGALVVADALAAAGLPLVATVVAASEDHRRELDQVRWAAHQSARLVDPSPEITAALADADLVISAGGTTVYELMALGRPSAICTVADNQERNYAQLVEAGLALGLGSLADLRADPAAGATRLAELLRERSGRARVAAAGFRLVDGRGRRRVADRFLSLTGSGSAG